jgi:protein TonB
MEFKKIVGIVFLLVFAIFNVNAQENTKTEELDKTQFNKDSSSFSQIGGKLPEYPGGMDSLWKFILENIVYPEVARQAGIEGKVVISFVVEKDGSLSSFEVVKKVHPLLNEEALRVVKLMPNWEPGKLNGKAVKVRFQLPIEFKLN